jgi:hypothetical protein
MWEAVDLVSLSNSAAVYYYYYTQKYWVFGLCPSSGYFLNNNGKTQRFGNWICFRPQLGLLERANLDHWTTDVRKH